jgi:hypothetical protein
MPVLLVQAVRLPVERTLVRLVTQQMLVEPALGQRVLLLEMALHRLAVQMPEQEVLLKGLLPMHRVPQGVRQRLQVTRMLEPQVQQVARQPLLEAMQGLPEMALRAEQLIQPVVLGARLEK